MSKVNRFDLKTIYLFHLPLTRKYVIFSWSGRKTFVFQNKIPKMWCLRKKLSVLLSISHAWYNDVYNIAGKFVWSNSITQVCFIFLLCTLMMSANESLKKKNFPSGWKIYKTIIGSYVICAFIEIWSTREVWRALKKLELLSATPQATLMHLSCSPNFPRSSYLDESMLTYEPIVKWLWSWILDKYYHTSHTCSYYI